MWNLFHVQSLLIIVASGYSLNLAEKSFVQLSTFSFLHLVNDKKFLYNAYLIDILYNILYILIHFKKAILILQATFQDK